MCLFKNGVPRVQSVPFSALHFWNLSDWYPHSCWWNPLRSQLTYPRKALSAMEKQTFEWFDPREFSISETAHLWFPSEIPWNPIFFQGEMSVFQHFNLFCWWTSWVSHQIIVKRQYASVFQLHDVCMKHLYFMFFERTYAFMQIFPKKQSTPGLWWDVPFNIRWVRGLFHGFSPKKSQEYVAYRKGYLEWRRGRPEGARGELTAEALEQQGLTENGPWTTRWDVGAVFLWTLWGKSYREIMGQSPLKMEDV